MSEIIQFLKNCIKLVDCQVIFVNYYIKQLQCYSFACLIVCLGSDNKIFIWNVGTAEVVTEVELPDIALSASWSYNGSLFVVSCKDKKIRIIDPRSGTVVQVHSCLLCY